MNKAKEKAISLFYSFEEYVESKDTTDNVTITDFKLQKENQKQCTLIVIDNIISVEFRNFEMNVYNELDFWNEVKLELKKL